MDEPNQKPGKGPKKQPQGFLAPSQDFEDLEWQVAEAYAKALNRLDYRCLEPYLNEDTVYESQHVFTPLIGKNAILDYLKAKFITISQAGARSRVMGEMAYMNSTYEGRPTVIVSQGLQKVALVLFKLKSGKVMRIDICGVLPSVDEATGTGQFPE